MNKEKKKCINQLTGFNLGKIMYILCAILTITGMSMLFSECYTAKFYFLNRPLRNVYVFYLLFYMSYLGIVIPRKTSVTKNASSDAIRGYRMYPVLPINRENLIRQELVYIHFTLIISGIGTTIFNIIYLLNSELKQIAGFFCLMTLLTCLSQIFNYLSRIYLIRFAEKICAIIMIIFMMTMVLLVFFDIFETYEHYLNDFFSNTVFKIFAGIPMVILSVLYVPVLLFVHYKFPPDKRKTAAWY